MSVASDPALVEPVVPVSRAWTARFSLVWFGYWTAVLVPIQLVLPDQLERIDELHKVRDFGLINGLTGVAALLTLPLFGALCDRTRSSFGRRRSWVAAGVVVFAIGLLATGVPSSWQGVAVAWVVANLGANMASAGLTAAIADEVPDSQRGMVSGAVYGPQAVGVVLGIAAVTGFTEPSTRYVVLAVVLAVSSVPFLLRFRDVPTALAPEPLTARGGVEGMWVSPRDNPDFAWAFGSRMLVNLGNALGTTYLLFFLQDGLEVADPEGDLLTLTAIYLVFTVLATYLGGTASDRLGRRRVFVATASLLQACAAISLAVAPSLGVAMVAAGLLGAGYGAYMSVDQALITQVLPDARSRAKDLGIMNVGSAGPQALAPLLASLVITSLGGYSALFGTAAVATLAGAAMVYRVKTVP